MQNLTRGSEATEPSLADEVLRDLHQMTPGRGQIT